MEGSAYLSPRDLGRAVGLSESSVRRWADDGRLLVERTAGGHRRIARAEAIRFIREAGLALLRPDLLGYGRPEPVDAGEGPSSEALLEALAVSDHAAVRGMLLAAFLNGVPLASLCDGPIRSALREVGILARRGPEEQVRERQAFDTFVHALYDIRSAISDRSGAPVALGAAAQGDAYVLPSAMATAVLADVGFRTFDLGTDLPRAVLLAAVRMHRPLLVWRSVSVESNAVAADARALAAMDGDAPVFVVGGRGLPGSDVRRAREAERLHSMAELAGFGRALLARERPRGRRGRRS